MLDINAEIVPAVSAGRVKLGATIEELLSVLSASRAQFHRREFTNSTKMFVEVSVPEYGLMILSDESGFIVQVSCDQNYKGFYRNYFPGMTIAQLRKVAKKILVIHGLIVPDGEFGIALDFPERFEGVTYDDIDDIDQLPSSMPLNQIHVLNREWWR